MRCESRPLVFLICSVFIILGVSHREVFSHDDTFVLIHDIMHYCTRNMHQYATVHAWMSLSLATIAQLKL